jgi:hypothetical protein
MPYVGPTPLFRGKAVMVDYAADLPNGQAIHGAVVEICRRAVAAHLGEDALVPMIQQAAQRQGCVARLAGRTADVLECTMTTAG